MTTDRDFEDEPSNEYASLIDAIYKTDIGRDRKAVLTHGQAVAIARARAFASMYNVPELSALCDVLMDTTVSVRGLGLKQLEKILAARVSAEDGEKESQRIAGRLMG